MLISVQNASISGDFGSWGSLSLQKGIVRLNANYTMLWRQSLTWETPEALLQSQGRIFIGSSVVHCYPLYPYSGIKTGYVADPSPPTPPPYNAIGAISNGICTNGGPAYENMYEGSTGLAVVSPTDIVMAGYTNDITTPGYHAGGFRDGMVTGMKINGGVMWKRAFGGSNHDHLKSIVNISDYNQVAAGFSRSNDGDVSGNHGDYDVWVVKLGQVNFVKGLAFRDDNSNGTRDAGEPVANNVLIETEKGSVKVGSITSSGSFNNRVDTGTYTTKAVSNVPYYAVVPASYNSTFTSYYNTDSFNFALQPVPGKRDYKINIFSSTPARPGFETNQTIEYKNIGTDTFTNKNITLIKDSRLTFLLANVTPASVSGDTIRWTIASLKPHESGVIYVTLKVAAPPAVNNGDELISNVLIDSTGDLTPANNAAMVRQRTTGSFDPNDKNESLGGKLPVTSLASQDLVYTIRFQNTGTDTAFNVVIRDTLDAKLDLSSIEMLQASHNYKLEIKDGNRLAWAFENILLPDSNVNEPASHGYITYRIRPKATVAVGDIIKNSASIYFDFNLPVVTNMHETLVVPSLLAQPAVSGLRGEYCSTEGVQGGKINNLPAPASGVAAAVRLDGNGLAIAADSTFSFNVNTLAVGAHVIEVIYSDGTNTKTTTINFNITAAVTPDVNVTSNITSVTNLFDHVIVAAANAAGGGSSPLYMFGKDRNFTNVWQAESINHVLNVSPNDLQNGDNWIYVRMKTSSTCFTAQTNIDSIKITVQLPAPVQPVITGIKASYCSNEGVQKAKIVNYPAPGTGSTATAKVNGTAVNVAMADTSFTFNVATLGAGAHTVEVTFTNPSGTRITQVDFVVAGLVTPDVNLTANIRNVSSLTDPVVITASNATGGGQNPLYTFSSNRTFADIIRAESASDVLTLAPSALKLGESWIYVRMKTSSNCFAQQTAIDSISITRYGSKGLVDPDFPNQTITANPNPVRSQLNVHGLSATKSYTILLYNQQGKVVYRPRANGRTVATLRVRGVAAGSYMLSIYDETKSRLIGTLNVVKQ